MKNLFDVPCVCEKAVEYGIAVKNKNEAFDRVRISGSEDAAKCLRPLFGDGLEVVESFIILVLNRANRVVGWSRISSGGRTSVTVDVAYIAKVAIDSLACGVILAHNHPSGMLVPSIQDERLTKRIQEALTLFDVKVLDHIILTGGDKYFSFMDDGRL